MALSKRQRRTYQKALAAEGPSDRFTDLMRAVIAGGTRPCDCCGMQRPASHGPRGVCGPCRASLGRIRLAAPNPDPIVYNGGDTAQPVAEPGVVYVDASFLDGFAGLAVVGALGQHHRTTAAATSTHAEVLALSWAMEIAQKGNVRDLTFRTDCQAAFHYSGGGKKALGWTVEQIPRRQNHRADRLAFLARRGER